MADDDVVNDDTMKNLLSELDSPDDEVVDLKPGDEGYVEPEPLKFGDEGYVLVEGDPGYMPPEPLKFGDEGYVLVEGDEGYVAPVELQPGDEGYVLKLGDEGYVLVEGDEGYIVPEPAPVVDNELELLKQTVREQSEQINKLTGNDETLRKTLTDNNLITPVDPVDPVDDPVAAMRSMQVSGFAETMRLTDKYADLDEVVSQDKVDQILSAAAMNLVQTQGMSAQEAQEEINDYVWNQQPNPYKYLYDTVKKYHPDYKKPPKVEETEEAKTARLKLEEEKKDPTKQQPVAPSITSVPGGGEGDKGGWTAAIIDALPESEIHKVPKAVYDKYMANELK